MYKTTSSVSTVPLHLPLAQPVGERSIFLDINVSEKASSFK